MFENSDWNIDENYLQDFNEDVCKTFQDKKEKTEIFKRGVINTKLNTNHLQLKFNCSGFEYSKNVTKKQFNDISSKKNSIVHILENTDIKTDLKCNETDFRFKFISEKEASISNNSLQSKSIKPIIKLGLQSSEDLLENNNKQKRKKSIVFLESIHNKNKLKKKSIKTIYQKDSLLYKEQSIFDKNKLNDSQKSTQRTLRLSRVNHTVVRKFPGPAGLLFKDNDECEQRDRNYVDESNKNISTIVCSQNTKNLFRTGAWQIMMDDMPSNFELFNIANIKDKAIEFSKILKKIPYLAGIIEYINYKPNNPHIIIKDLSGQIDACIHHTICKIYPNTLGTNTVILLKDVRLIVTSKKYVCIIISIKNLVSIYSDHLRLVQTNLLKQLLNKNYNANLNK